MGCGVIISETAPDEVNNYTWFKPSTSEVYDKDSSGNWILAGSFIPRGHSSSHEDGGTDRINKLGNVHLKGKVYIGAGDDKEGQDATIVLSKGTLVFKSGVLIRWTPAE